MAAPQTSSASAEFIEIELRQPWLAALLAWLWPGAGHLYQRRYAKGTLFMVCILATFFCGLTLGGGRVVYASWARNDVRWHYICQLGVGLPALPALAQSYRVSKGEEPYFSRGEGDAIMAPPRRPVLPNNHDHLAQWHLDYHTFFELGTMYTMIAGLLNVLAIYDAACGPLMIRLDGKPAEKPPGKGKASPKTAGA